MSVPIVDASTIAATIDAFRIANAPFPSARPESVGSPRAPVVIEGAAPEPSYATGKPAAAIVELSVAATAARTAMERTLFAALDGRPSAPSGRPPEVAAQNGGVAPPDVSSLDRLVAPILTEVEATVLATSRIALDDAYLAASGGVRLAAALFALAPTDRFFAALDRRALFAIATDIAGPFSPVERKGARAWLERLASAILSGLKGPSPAGGRDVILKAFAHFLDAAGPEEKRSAEWVVQRAAVQFGRERLAAMEARVMVDDLAPPHAMVDIVKAALSRPVAGSQPIADASALVANLRDTPLLATAFLTPEMLLVGLAAFQRAGTWRARGPAPKPGGRRRPEPDGGTLLILPLEMDWDSVAGAGPAIDAWERASGLFLPDDYLGFLESHHGGRVYPNMFDYSVPLTGASTTSATTFLDRLYAWGTVEEVWRGGRFAGCLPSDMLAIGCDPGGMEILLSLRPDDLGAISCWPHASEPWGSRTNRRVYPLADSFEAFLFGLRDVSDGAGHRYWDRPTLRRLVRRLEL